MLSVLSLDCFWLLDLLLDFTSNQIMPTLLKDLDSGPPKPAESLPERMDGKQCTKLCLRVNLFFVGMRFIVIWELWNAQEKLKSLIRRGTLPVKSSIVIV